MSIHTTNKDSIFLNGINTYDEVPYESYPYPQTNPAHLYAIGKYFGMNPPKVENANILELGCASGENIIPISIRYPHSKCTGIDLSKNQIKMAKKQTKAMGLKNMQFINASITDIDESYGMFDYIICHGVFSWVPQEVRNAIFKICSSLLSANGIAYISYNTLPGWNSIKTAREIMQFQAQMYDSPEEQVRQARLALNFIKDSLAGKNSLYAATIKKVAEEIEQKPNFYVYHEYLEENNSQFYFKDLMHAAEKYSLQYVGDANLSYMSVIGLPKSSAKKINAIKDIVDQVQYIDFIKNRTFSCILLCHNAIKLDRNINTENIKSLYFCGDIKPKTVIHPIDINDAEKEIEYYIHGKVGNPIFSKHPITKAMLYTFSDNLRHPISFKYLVNESHKKLANYTENQVSEHILGCLVQYISAGLFTMFASPASSINVIQQFPKVAEYSRYQVTHGSGDWVTNELHEKYSLNLLEKFAITYMDGKHDKEMIIAKLMEHINNGEITIFDKKVKVVGHKEQYRMVTLLLDEALNRMKDGALLKLNPVID